MKQLTDILHLLLCTEQHLHDMMKINDRHDGICYYYLEGQIASNDTMPDHEKWKGVTTKFKTSLNLKSDEEALEFVRSCVLLSKDLRVLVNDNENRANFIRQLLL